MNIVVLGSGVVGVTTAYYLAKAGHAVTVVDRQPGPAMETSFANAGEISPGYASPWAGPGVPMKAIKWLVMKHGPLVIRPKADVAMWIWLLKMLRNCTHQRYAVNKSRMVELAEYSRDTLRDLRRDIGISYDDRALGTLQLFRTQKQLDGAATDIDVLRDYGVPFELLDADGCVEAEPGLADARDKIAGGLRLPGDETGDCEMFTRALVTHAAALGVTFRYGVRVLSLKMANDRISSIATDQGDIAADAFVVALGSYSPLLLKQIGLSIPVFPVKGYSITVPITQPENAPISTIMDETYKVAITRLGDRIRVGGTAEISGYDLSLDPARRATLDLSVSELFGKAGDLSRASFWAGLRPMTPDGPPIIGAARYNNLFLNTGHGTLGWTMACGSARVLSDLMSGVKPSIDISQLSMNRYANSISSAAA